VKIQEGYSLRAELNGPPVSYFSNACIAALDLEHLMAKKCLISFRNMLLY
jgi:hypothetical protein